MANVVHVSHSLDDSHVGILDDRNLREFWRRKEDPKLTVRFSERSTKLPDSGRLREPARPCE